MIETQPRGRNRVSSVVCRHARNPWGRGQSMVVIATPRIRKGGDVRKRVQIYFWFQLIGKCILPLQLLVKSKRQPMVNIRVTWDAHANSRLGQLWCSDQLEATHPSIFHPRSCFLEVDQMDFHAPL